MKFFSDNLIFTLKQAANICQTENSALVMPKHLLAALEKTPGSLAYDILFQSQNPVKKMSIIQKEKKSERPNCHEETALILAKATKIAWQNKHCYVGTEHLLAAILELPAIQLNAIVPQSWPAAKIKKHLAVVFNSSSHLPNFSKIFNANFTKFNPLNTPTREQSLLAHFTTDLTNVNTQKEINPVIGRENEIQRLIQILNRKDKNNPVILGESGVGKTALVEGLAKKILEKDVPPALFNKKILNLDIGLIVAGTTYRGEFEDRLKKILDEVECSPNIILFIDELHNIIGAGSASGSMDAANMLKPLLARGKLRCIGATTPDEFKKHIEADPALERRFQAIHLAEPNSLEARKILEGVKNNYQNFHGVSFSSDALETAIIFSVRYIQDKLLPDKAIDLIDEAASKVKIKNQSTNGMYKELFQIEKKLIEAKEQKEKAILRENYHEALEFKNRETTLKREFDAKENQIAQCASQLKLKVNRKDILEIVSQKTNIPLAGLKESAGQMLGDLTANLKSAIIGQDLAIDLIMKAVSRAELGLADESKPRASFLFIGPSGCGKTFFCREFAKRFLKNQEAFIHIDMSEFSEKFQTTKLIGSPAGYVGYREGNKFTDLVKKNPHCVILLDEIEKAHPDVLDLLLQILEYGHITDAAGRKINFKNAIIFMTSNALGNKFSGQPLGFVNNHSSTFSTHFASELKTLFKPEFINRIGNIIAFRQLSRADLKIILQNKITELIDKLKSKGVQLNVSAAAIERMAELAEDQNSGARAVANIIQKEIEQLLLDKLVSSAKKKFSVQILNNNLLIK